MPMEQGNLILKKTTNNHVGSTNTHQSIEYKYNSRNQLRMVVTYDNGSAENYTQFYYDSVGNKVRMYTGLSTPLVINGLDSVSAGSDTEYSVTKYEYDRFNRMKRMIDPMQQEETYEYDINGNLKRKEDRNGAITVNTYDGLNRLRTTNVTTDTEKLNTSSVYEYSLSGRLTKSSNSEAVSHFYYDDLGRLTKEETQGGVSKLYNYNANNNRISFKVISGGSEISHNTYSYNTMDRMHQLSTNGNLTATYQYNDNGYTEFINYANNTVASYTYNLANKLKSLSHTINGTITSQFSYDYNVDGSLYQKVELAGGNVATTSYQYDGLGRLYKTFEAGKVSTFNYDDANNRKSLVVQQGSALIQTDYNYDLNNRLIEESVGESNLRTVTTYDYDNNGNQLSKVKEIISSLDPNINEDYLLSKFGEGEGNDIVFYTYNGKNELIEVESEAFKSSYAYDPKGIRIWKMVNGQKTTHIWDGSNLAADVKPTGTSIYIRGNQLLASVGDNGTVYYLHNGHGDVVETRQGDGSLINSYKYDAFGVEIDSDTADTNPFRYGGQYFDEETDTYYLRARNYQPGIGRFTTEDTYKGQIADPLTLNLYAYAQNNPLMYHDPTGHFIDIIADIGFAIYDTIELIRDPSWENAGYLALDVGSAFVPFLSGTGAAVRTATHVDDVMKHSDEVYDLYNKCNCFTSGTKVLTDKGEKPIEDIEVGDMVLSKDDTTGEVAYKEVLGLFQKQAEEIHYVHIGDEIIEVTGEHPFWLDGKGWTLVKDLKVGDLLVTSDGTKLAIDKIEKEPRQATVYNFEVEDFNSYFVSNLGIWVHNCAVKGTVDSLNPKEINFMQSSIKNKTGDYTVLGNADALKSGKLSPSDLETINVWKNGAGKIWTLDHRRLAAFRIAGTEKIPVQWATKEMIESQMWKMTTKNGGSSIKLKMADGNNLTIK
ncbi:hypothetical protein K0T92_15180 [Paenibacillus oenotherae]|uniref:Hint domain-containing protein n=1 Tax=Paenibacillus oenotherae TaxID=1435645 RepID=A0ABS7D817_9BACL|nr:polymorphic toxin-type HINT domain-containing protein [Paenibacillus oenotherae]MBW7476087.1 hypothetical protein [Paenibacillus oenotherae]